jgi:protease-4
MTEKQRSLPVRLVVGFWRGVTRVRLILSNLLFLGLLVLLFLLLRGETPETLPDRAALLLNPVGTIVEEKTYVDPMSLLMLDPVQAEQEVLMRDIIDAIDYARTDPAISALVMDLGQLFGPGVSKSGEISVALRAFRESGKPIVAFADFYGQGQYLLASEADTVLLHPLGGVEITGFGRYLWFIRDALEKLQLNMHVFKAGEHKSVAEPFQRNDMSEAEKEISLAWLTANWQRYTGVVEERRGLPAGSIDAYAGNLPELLTAAEGDAAEVALQAGLVDRLAGRRETREYLAEVVGARDDEGDFERVAFERYLKIKRPLIARPGAQDKVAVVTAKGMILNGTRPAGSIGGDSLGQMLREAADDDHVRAIVLRVDSGGGSAFASEVIRQQLLYAKSRGKPVLVSMGSVAASGGYWISASADEIWATPTTITGSIGVFGAFPTFEKLLDKAGVSTDGVGTTALAGAMRADQPLDPGIAGMLQAGVDHTYDHFIGLVAEGRSMAVNDVDAISQGRIWGAADAREAGLVDELGSLRDVIERAAEVAGLEEYDVDYREHPLSAREQFFKQLFGQVRGLGQRVPVEGWRSLLQAWLQPADEALQFLTGMNDPAGIYARCTGCRVE